MLHCNENIHIVLIFPLIRAKIAQKIQKNCLNFSCLNKNYLGFFGEFIKNNKEKPNKCLKLRSLPFQAKIGKF